ncbi:kinase-like domain-containing protein [Apodospora peruviana]|uniref:Kinase-like domain-containing protein n=1 Tax=Apodospora peruviana TaxID=516989 RepID=A0AAE0LYY6_9PEZI|nr:kinase-like domain-containing protein [Apodospora peruviana]
MGVTQLPAKKAKGYQKAVAVLEREVAVMKQSSGPRYEAYLTQFLGQSIQRNLAFVFMEYLPFGDMAQYVEGNARFLSEDEAMTITRQVLSCLQLMHDSGYVHRDIKPTNIFIKRCPPTGEWWVKIGDFGIACHYPDRCLRGPMSLVGT